MEDLKKICHVLGLQRANLERDIAALDARLKALEVKKVFIAKEKTRLTHATLSGEISENIAADAVVLQRWVKQQDTNITDIQAQQEELLDLRKPKVEALTKIIVKEDVLKQKLEVLEKAHYNDWVETQASDRLETWVNTHIV